MSAGVYTIVCEKGSSFRMDITYTNNDGTPVHLGGFKARMDVRRSRTTDSRLITRLETDNGHIQMPSPETGEIILAMPSSETLDLPEGEFYYDLLIWQDIIQPDMTVNREVIRVVEGNFVIRSGVTQL